MPKILRSDTKESYISRCIAYCVKNEGLKPDQAAGKCYGLWTEHKKKQRKSKADQILDAIAEGFKKNG